MLLYFHILYLIVWAVFCSPHFMKVVQELHFDHCLFGNQLAVYRVREIIHKWCKASTKRVSPQNLNHAEMTCETN